jgi:hypothetical protein
VCERERERERERECGEKKAEAALRPPFSPLFSLSSLCVIHSYQLQIHISITANERVCVCVWMETENIETERKGRTMTSRAHSPY